MAENGNRGPNDSFRRSGRRRREPPIIDAAATEVPVDRAESSPVPRETVEASAEAPVPDVSGAAGDPSSIPAEATTQEIPAVISPEPEGAAGDDEPVLFGHARRDAARAAAADEAHPPTGAEAAPAEAEAIPSTGHVPDPLEPAPIASGGLGEPPPPIDAAPAPDPAPTLPPREPAAPSNTLAGALGVAAVILLGIIGWLLYSGGNRGGDVAATVDGLKTRVAALEARPDPAVLRTQVAALEKRVADAETQRSALGKEVAALSARLDAAAGPAPAGSPGGSATSGAQPSQAGGDRAPASGQAPAVAAPALATAAAVTALAAKVDGIDTRVAALATEQTGTARTVAALPKPVPPDFGPVNAKIAALETDVNAADAKVNGSDARFNGFDAKINGIDAKVNGFGEAMNRLTARTNGLESKLDDQAARMAKFRSELPDLLKVELGPLRLADAALDARVAKVESAMSAPKDGARVTEARAVGSADETRATPIALLGETVERALAAGKPYRPEIAALKNLGADPALVARLGPASAGGVLGLDALTTQWDAVRGQVLATMKPVVPGAEGTLNRFLASATSIVQVHRVGAPEGDDTSALVGQIDAALAGGDVPAALAAWDKLPAAGKAASQGWADAARRRADAVAAAAELVGGAITTLGRPPS